MTIQLARVLIVASIGKGGRHSQEGLTLLELITSLVIVGILSAIALPSFLNLSLRSRHAEAQINVGSMMRAQQAYYTQSNDFTTNLVELGLGISADTQFYQYRLVQFSGHQTLAGASVDGVISSAIPLGDVRGYMGKTWVDMDTSIPEVTSVMCRGDVGASYFMNSRTFCP
ncbi:MAG: type IV pilin-like G/H family protein [Cyanobacteria bacterium J06626_14]